MFKTAIKVAIRFAFIGCGYYWSTKHACSVSELVNQEFREQSRVKHYILLTGYLTAFQIKDVIPFSEKLLTFELHFKVFLFLLFLCTNSEN